MFLIGGYGTLFQFIPCNAVTYVSICVEVKNEAIVSRKQIRQGVTSHNNPPRTELLEGNGSTTLQQYIHAATSDNTRKAYRSAIRQFEKWGGRLPTDTSVLVNYLLERAGELNPRTLDLHLNAISQWHQVQMYQDPSRSPTVNKTMEGIRRLHGRPIHKAKALQLEHIVSMLSYLNALPDTNKKSRDIALLLIGFLGAFRRSELVAIVIKDLSWEPEGVLISLPKSKTDQEKQGATRALPFGTDPFCPVLALKRWINKAGIIDGPIFRPVNRWDQIQNKPLNPAAINEFLKGLGNKCNFDFSDELSSHSFRRGMSTSAARENVDFALIKKQGGWKSDATVWGYMEEGQQFSENASSTLLDKMFVIWNQRQR
jgi:integrase